MRTAAILTALSLTAALVTAKAGATLQIIEQAIESSTLSVSIPADAGGSMLVKACASCAPILLRLTPQSKFRIGKSPVPFAELHRYVRGAGARQLGIFYDAKSRTITRLIVADDQFRRPG